MAAAEAPPAAGTRRAVIRSERFVQWQRQLQLQLSSARQAPQGSRQRSDDGKMSGIQNQQEASEDEIVLNNSRVIWDGAGEEDDRDVSDISQERAAKHQQCHMDYNCAPKISPLQFYKNEPLILGELVLFNGKQNPQEQSRGSLQDQQELVPTRSITRRGQNKHHELRHPTRGQAEDANGLEGKRSTRSNTKPLRTNELPPPPLKLPKLHVVLSRKELQEDWIKMTGQRYTGKPRKSALAHLGLELCTSMTCASMIRRYLSDS